MNLPARFLRSLLLLNPCQSVFFPGVANFGLAAHVHQNIRLERSLRVKMAHNLERCGLGLETEPGIVRPALEMYAEEAIETLKAGQVIAVPTDTLYGFACDACLMKFSNLKYELEALLGIQ